MHFTQRNRNSLRSGERIQLVGRRVKSTPATNRREEYEKKGIWRGIFVNTSGKSKIDDEKEGESMWAKLGRAKGLHAARRVKGSESRPLKSMNTHRVKTQNLH